MKRSRLLHSDSNRHGHHSVQIEETGDRDFVAKREPFRVEPLKKAQEACARGDLVLAGALAEVVDYAVLIFNGADPKVAERFAAADPHVANTPGCHDFVEKNLVCAKAEVRRTD